MANSGNWNFKIEDMCPVKEKNRFYFVWLPVGEIRRVITKLK